jgi:hypothetical protein
MDSDGREVVARDGLSLRAAVLVASERVDHVRGVGLDVKVEHLPVAIRGLTDGELVPDASGVAVAPDRWLSHRCSLRFSSSRVRLKSAASSNRAATASSAPACSANSAGSGPGSAMNV